ncbi:DNA cross-link repair 1A protein [Rhynchocyon petersi]
MLEYTFSEDDIWEYKSKRKLKPVPPNGGSETIPMPIEKARDGKGRSKRSRSKKGQKRTLEAKEKARGDEVGGTLSQASVASDRDSGGGDSVQQSQDKTTPTKHCKTHKNKHISPKIRPVYDGYCPNCQMPFSSLLGQTPRWHVFECLDSPQVSETECPDGLLCTSTIPSHYKRYTHLLLAQSRANTNSFSTPADTTGAPLNCFSDTNPGFHSSLEKRWPLKQKQTENLKTVSDDPFLMTQGLRKSPSPSETNKKASFSTNILKSQQALKCTELVANELVGLPLVGEELGGSEHLILPEDDLEDCEISYSPLESDEETYDSEEKLDDSQQELFSTESSKDGSLEEDASSCALLQKRHGPLLTCQEESFPEVNGFSTQDKYNEGLYKDCTPTDLSPSASQNKESILSRDDPAPSGDCSMLFPPASAQVLDASNYLTTRAKPEMPAFHPSQGNKQKQVVEGSAVYSQVSLPLLEKKMLNPFKVQGEECLSFHLSHSRVRELSQGNVNTMTASNSACSCREALDGILDSSLSVLNTEHFPSTPTAADSMRRVSAGPKCNATQSPSKAMKQMDIGVYFGLPPKRKEEKLPEESTLKGTQLNPVLSPNEKRSRRGKRKAENSLSDLESDAKSLNGSQLPVELPREKTQRRQRKRCKRSNSLQEGASRKSDHVNTESGPVNLSKDKVFIKSAGGELQRGRTNPSEVSSAGGLGNRRCPFYKKIPGTGFTVDAFQYGPIEECTAYFLTHFHSDHYAGLSKNFTSSLYCSAITGNLVKKKLHVQEQYIHPLPLDTECVVQDVRVVLLDANHCPGAVMILFHLPNGTVILHTGDFRADPSMERSLLASHKVHTLYLDTTYCSPEYSFPPQQQVIQFAINTAFEAVTLNPRTLVVCGTYSIGKEKVFLAIADVLGSKVGMSQEKYTTLRCLNIPEMNSLITTDMGSAFVHLLPMMQINFKGLQKHLQKYCGKYNQILAFRPTGWTHSNNITRVSDITPQKRGNISIYGIPYSEHSSYLEMKRFVQWLKPQKIIPTVNVGSWKSRSSMERYFREWKLEAGY